MDFWHDAPGWLVAIIALLTLVQSRRNAMLARKTHNLVNGVSHELQAAVKGQTDSEEALARAEGVAQGEQQERDRGTP